MTQVLQKQVTVIAANPLLAKTGNEIKRLRVAAYCRVSTDEDEQLNSYEAQIAYYTETIAKNPNWIFAGIYADEGITGTLTSKRKDFLRLMNDCDKGKIDMILTKSISRFARNTVDSLEWVRKLRSKNIGVYFEEQAIDSLKAENEMLIGLFSVIAQAESENISANVKWGIHQSMKNGNFCSNFTCFGYKRGENGIPEIVEEQAKVVRFIFDRYLDGNSLEQIIKILEENHIPNYSGNYTWKKQTVRDMLENEKYVGDLLLQKTFRVDCISKKTKINRGELPKYLVSNNHPAIIERYKFNLVQAEIARRGNKRKKSETGKTEQGKYSGKYALSELLICGECGSNYRRTSKSKKGKKQYVWRCINRIDNGKESCDAVGAEEQKLQEAICKCLNKLFAQKDETLRLLKNSLKYALSEDDNCSEAYMIENEIVSLEEQSENLMSMMNTTGGDKSKFLIEIENNFKKIKALRQRLETVKVSQKNSKAMSLEYENMINLFDENNLDFSVYDDVVIRRLVECIRVMKDRKIVVILKGGLQAEEYF